MYGISSGAENGSYSLTFLGKKVGRHRSVAPAGKQRAWETTNICFEDPVVSLQPGRVPVAVQVDLPGSVPELQDERPCPIIHNMQFNQYENSAAGSSDSHLSHCSDAEQATEAERLRNVKIYIPYKSAELCITQIAEDMEAMKKTHLEMVQELEENFQITARETNESTVRKIRSHYQNKLNTLRRILDIYQEKVEKKNADWKKRVAACMESDPPLEGAKARLEELQESLYQRERELTELLEAEKSPIPLAPQQPCSILLSTVIQKAHVICTSVAQTRALLDQMVEENKATLLEAKDRLQRAKEDREDRTSDKEGSDEYESILSLLQETVREYEISQIALDCLKTGESPVIKDGDQASEQEDNVGQESIRGNTEGGKSVGQQFLLLQDQLKQVKEEKKKIIENYTSERTMRKKYYNIVEDMKGKIRVFCRIRPVSRTMAAQGGTIVVEKIDDYSVTVETSRGPREFLFDKVFSGDASQEDLFHDTNRLIQLAIDGYNVCIFAYGQTGSGKTFTMVGDKEQKNPGIIPRSFDAMFDIIRDNSTKFDFKVSAYMLELYNDRLQDLFVSQAGEAHAQPQSHGQARRVEIKRNRKGVVFAQGAETKEVSSAQELYALFQQACANQHISATKMNVESSRSHLIVGIMVESRNLTNGSLSTGKLSLVDLAGSERAAKTGAKDHQLKEANSINKSLSALGDVISALSAELPHVPYRNSKLTQVMQDSLGGNAKTLMIVNVSPSECNLDETLTSLIYATRVKAITNNAQRNVESKEIAQLKEVIMKLRSGQTVEDEDA
ncbi:Kinesin-like protein KIFC3 [Channa argus]|uniref:Kinesin-like protein n=1 Tax=Channa argus TaxID=215402 RepID=A0A6G1Q074_CHAAH|nr:Kinesin-like protein KIFC3 [Channa argus]